MKIAILGFGREGKSLLKFLRKSRIYRNAELVICDRDTNIRMHPNDTNTRLRTGKAWIDTLTDFDLVFRSPGVPYNLLEIKAAIKRGVQFSSNTKLFFDEVEPILRHGSGQVIGVTGTKGKGTTSTLLYQIFKNWQKSVSPEQRRRILLAGNIGKPALEILPKIDKNTSVILELSSFQLQDLKKSPQVAVITEIFPDHMDVHKNMREYIEAKSNVARYQKRGDAIFYFKDNLLSHGIARKSSGKKIAVAAPDTLEKNRTLASTVARYLGCPENIIQKTLKKFRGLEHRLEFVRSIEVHSNVLKNVRMNFYNDSASTNPQTTAAAVLSFSEPIILIAGGKDKNLDYAPLAEAIKKSENVKQIILIGENKNKIKKVLSRVIVPVQYGSSLEFAVASACKIAKTLYPYTLNPVILFSPGAASFDMFKDYTDRGEKFKKAVRGLKP